MIEKIKCHKHTSSHIYLLRSLEKKGDFCMLSTGNVQHVVKHSMAYGFVLSQPFSFYVDAYPVLQNQALAEAGNLTYGNHNEVVRVLQHKLQSLSYFDDKIDGKYGVLTEYALKKFQKDNQLTINGQADTKTVDTLVRAEREKYLRPLKSISTTYYPGDQGKDIKKIQRALQYFGYYERNIDGIYGPLTDNALKAFQKDNGIKVEEEVNVKTVNTIYSSESSESVEEEPEKKEPPKKEQEKQETKGSKPVKKTQVNGFEATQLVSSAKQFIGTPYVWGGESPKGFDCSGFIQYVFQQQGLLVPRTVSELWNFSKPVNTLSVGDFVFFETTRSGPSHMGIYTGNNQFIHAGESRGVEVSEMSNPYWQERYLGAKRVYIEDVKKQ